MNQLMCDWLNNNWNNILQKYPEAKPVLSFFMDYFSTCAGRSPFVDILKKAIRGEGDSLQEISTYLLMNSVVDEGHVVDAAEFYFNGEFDGKVPFKTLMCAEKTGGFNLVNYRHSSGVYHEQETEDLHRRI